MNRCLTVSILCCGLVAGATFLKAEDAAKPAPAATSTNSAVTGKAQTTCPVMKGNPINKDLFVEADGKRIYVCCGGCIDTVKKNFATYAKQLEDAGVVLEKAKAAAPAKAE